MATNINQIPDNVLTRDQRFLINMYLSMYNSTIRQIDLLNNNLDEIRESIDYIVTTSLQNAPRAERTRTRTRERRIYQTEADRFNTQPVTRPRERRIYQTEADRFNTPPVTRSNVSGPGRSPPLRGEEIFEFTFSPLDTQRLSRELQNVFNNFYNPVPIAPTLDQINIATRRIQFSEIVNPVNTTCPISLERFSSEQCVSQIKQCSHIFNTTQMNVWFSNNPKCPVCRYDIRDYIETIPPEQPQPTSQEEEKSEEPEATFQEEEKYEEPVRNTRNTLRQENFNRYGVEHIDASNNLISNLSSITNILMSDLFRNERGSVTLDFVPLDGSNNQYSLWNDIFNLPTTETTRRPPPR